MTISNTNEQALAQLIERVLCGSTIECRKADSIELTATGAYVQMPSADGFHWTSPTDLLSWHALDGRRLCPFLTSLYDLFAEWHGSRDCIIEAGIKEFKPSNCGERVTSTWNPVDGHCTKCNGKMLQVPGTTMLAD